MSTATEDAVALEVTPPPARAAAEGLRYCGHLPDQDHRQFAELLNDTDWQQDSYIAFGRRFRIPRLQAWVADPGVEYRYSDNLLEIRPWTPLLKSLLSRVALHTGQTFNAVLLTCYRHGEDHVGWHSDDEVELGTDPVIASLSLGATRSLELRHRQSGQHVAVPMHDGDLWLMERGFQHAWQHRVPIESAVCDTRINLTFRKVCEDTGGRQVRRSGHATDVAGANQA